jgi:hypothetical protein
MAPERANTSNAESDNLVSLLFLGIYLLAISCERGNVLSAMDTMIHRAGLFFKRSLLVETWAHRHSNLHKH